MNEARTPAGPVASFHRLAVRPHARLADLRLIFTDTRWAKRHVPGLRHMEVAICGNRRSGGMSLPPSAFDREVIAFWDDEASYRAFLAGPLMTRWKRSASLFSALLEPISSRGRWGGMAALADVPTNAKAEGPIVVFTHAVMPVRIVARWYLKVVPSVVGPLRQARGLIAASTGAGMSLLRTFTVTFWTDQRAMIEAAYGPTPHGDHVKWGKAHLDASFARFRILEGEGLWAGRNPAAELLDAGRSAGQVSS